MITFGRRKTRKAKKPTRPRRRAIVRRVPRPIPSYRGLSQWTPYKFKFTLLPNILTSNNTGTVTFQSPIAGTSEVGMTPFGPLSVGSLVPSATGLANYVDFGCACAFKLSDIQNVTLYAGIYDAYRIDKVTVHMQYLSNSASVNGSGIFPTFYMYNDPDDQNIPSSLQQITAKQGVRKFYPGNGARTVFSHNIVPRAAEVLAAAPTAGFGIGRKHKWINCTGTLTSAVPHFGYKVWVTDWETGSNDKPNVANVVKFQFTYHMSFRGPLTTN